jgi:hypothetical protein
MPLAPSWIDALFSRFEAMYGKQFIDKWQNVDMVMVKEEWADALDGMDGETIKKALNACRLNNPYPPNSPEFYQLCRQFRVASHRNVLGLPKPNYPKEKALENLAKMKQMLSESPLMAKIGRE